MTLDFLETRHSHFAFSHVDYTGSTVTHTSYLGALDVAVTRSINPLTFNVQTSAEMNSNWIFPL